MTDYSTYNASKLRHALNSTRKQIAKFENEIIKADKQIKICSAKRETYLQREAIIARELNMKLAVPNEETRKALDDDFIVASGINHTEFMASLDDEDS
ncbi:hypothetical protein [Helicobacter sp. T3_23-1059]